MPDRFVPPWADDFSNDANNAWSVATDVLKDISGGTIDLPQLPTLPTIPQIPIPASNPVPSTTTVTVSPTPAVPVTNVSEAMAQLSPIVKADIAAYIQQVIAGTLEGKQAQPVPNVTYDGQALTHVAASAHAWRTFLIGMSTTAISAILDAVGQQTHVDYFSKQGLAATGVLAVGTLVSTAISYIGRLKITPDYEQKLLAAPAGTVTK